METQALTSSKRDKYNAKALCYIAYMLEAAINLAFSVAAYFYESVHSLHTGREHIIESIVKIGWVCHVVEKMSH